MPARVGSRARRFRRAPACAGRRGSVRLADRGLPETSGRRDARRARAFRRAKRTWTLDALRAATEPVKVEAMQAIVVVWCFVREGCVCRNGDRDTRCEVKRKTFFAFFANHPRETDSKRRQLIGRDAPTETRGRNGDCAGFRDPKKRSGVRVFLNRVFRDGSPVAGFAESRV